MKWPYWEERRQLIVRGLDIYIERIKEIRDKVEKGSGNMDIRWPRQMQDVEDAINIDIPDTIVANLVNESMGGTLGPEFKEILDKRDHEMEMNEEYWEKKLKGWQKKYVKE
ncbi:MAG: hypothetical protein ACRCVN_05925 [Spirochaetia bacterium]